VKLPNWFKITWWIALVLIITEFLYKRYPDLIAGHAAPVDLFAFGIWVALLLVPLFSEINFLGIKLKQEVEDLKRFVAAQIIDVRNDIRNTVDVRTTVSQQFTMPSPDSQLPKLEEITKAAVAEALAAYGLKPENVGTEKPQVPPDTAFLFTTRYQIEMLINRIIISRQLAPMSVTSRPLSFSEQVRLLVQAGLIEPRLERAMREVYAICSQAIHGREVSSAKGSFVKDVSSELIAALSAIG
jgi:hypothetical protein